MAQQTTGGQRWFDRNTMTGNWGGERTSLEDAGINLRAHFTTESAGNPSGGNYQAVRYTQQIDFGADFDLERLMRIHNAKIQVTLTDRVGRSLSADALGNQFAAQELYGAGQNFRLAEMNYQQDFLKHKVTIELGWSPIGDNFAGLPYFCNLRPGVADWIWQSLSSLYSWQSLSGVARGTARCRRVPETPRSSGYGRSKRDRGVVTLTDGKGSEAPWGADRRAQIV
jgi:carbohydrate-selective porin OprB